MAKIDILVKSDGTTATAQELINSPGNGGVAAGSTDNASGTGTSKGIVMRSIGVNQLINSGISVVKSGISITKSNYGNFTGDYIGQNKIDRAFSVAEDFASLGTSIASGALSGAGAGVPGLIAGAAVGAVVGGINLGTSYASAATNQYLKVSRVNAQANYNAQRIGTILTNGNR